MSKFLEYPDGKPLPPRIHELRFSSNGFWSVVLHANASTLQIRVPALNVAIMEDRKRRKLPKIDIWQKRSSTLTFDPDTERFRAIPWNCWRLLALRVRTFDRVAKKRIERGWVLRIDLAPPHFKNPISIPYGFWAKDENSDGDLPCFVTRVTQRAQKRLGEKPWFEPGPPLR